MHVLTGVQILVQSVHYGCHHLKGGLTKVYYNERYRRKKSETYNARQDA